MRIRNSRIATSCWAVALLTLACAFGISGCAPSQSNSSASEEKGSDASQDVLVEWSMQADCAACHSDEASSLTDASCQVSAGHSDLTCVACHTDEQGLKAAHDNAKEGSQPKKASGTAKTEVSKDVCLSCHEDDYATVASSDYVLTDSKGNTANPHALPSNQYHDALSCGDCHSMHSSNPIEQTALSNCTGCHHENVFQCGTCHEKPSDM